MIPPTDSLEAALSKVPLVEHRDALGNLSVENNFPALAAAAREWMRRTIPHGEQAAPTMSRNQLWSVEGYNRALCNPPVLIPDYPALAAAAREWMRQQIPTRVQPAWETRPDMARWYNTALADVAKALGLKEA